MRIIISDREVAKAPGQYSYAPVSARVARLMVQEASDQQQLLCTISDAATRNVAAHILGVPLNLSDLSHRLCAGEALLLIQWEPCAPGAFPHERAMTALERGTLIYELVLIMGVA